MNREEKHLELNEKKWDRWSATLESDGWKSKFLRQAQQEVINLLNLKDDVRFLDVGCGTGWAVGQAFKLFNGKGTFYGADLSEMMIEKAKENFKSYENIHFIKANAESIPLEDNFFDIIISTNSFHHYLHPDKALKEFYRLLKPGGKLYILDPTADSVFLKLIDKIVKLLEREHVKMYSSEEFKSLYNAAGIKYSETKAVMSKQKVHIGEKLLQPLV